MKCYGSRFSFVRFFNSNKTFFFWNIDFAQKHFCWRQKTFSSLLMFKLKIINFVIYCIVSHFSIIKRIEPTCRFLIGFSKVTCNGKLIRLQRINQKSFFWQIEQSSSDDCVMFSIISAIYAILQYPQVSTPAIHWKPWHHHPINHETI